MLKLEQFNSLDINNFFESNEYLLDSDFHYGDITGYAKIVGYQIVFFFVDQLEALSFEDILDIPILVSKSNEILKYLSLDYQIGEQFNFSEAFNHNYQFKVAIYTNIISYYYLKDNMLIVFDVNENSILVGFEIIKHKQIINDRINCWQ